jgi:predicted DNA-binding ribbon-helix-helix protein
MASEGDVLPEPKTQGARQAARASSGFASPWEQRILQLDGKRYSLRLELEFWAALEAIASRRKLRLNRVVAEIASHRSRESNLSSLVRVFCLGEIERGSAARTLALDSAGVTALLEAAPAPGLLLDADQLILAANGAFVHWSGLKRALLLRQKLAAHFQLASTSSFAGLWLRPLREEETRIASVVPDGIAATAKLVPLLSARGRRLCVLWVIA